MRQTSRRLGGAVLAALLLGALSGCVHHKVHGDTVTYTYEWWLAAVTVLGAVVAGTVGWFLTGLGGNGALSWFFGIKRTGYGLLIGAPVVAFLALPAVFVHYVKVDDYHFEVRHGWWWALETHNVRFDQLAKLDFAEEERPTRDGTSSTFFLDCVSHAGKRERVQLDFLMREALGDILKRAEQRGVKLPEAEDEDGNDGDRDGDADDGK